MLTPKQEKFCLEYIKLGNGTEAYRRSYQNKMTEKQINEQVWKFKQNPKISQRLDELRNEIKKDYLIEINKGLDAGFREVLRILNDQIAKDSDKINAFKSITDLSGLKKDTKEINETSNKKLEVVIINNKKKE